MIKLFLGLFERQVKIIKIYKEIWLSYIINILPNEITNFIVRAEEYRKELLLLQDFCVYRFLRMQFGLQNNLYYSTKMMSEIITLLENYAIPYLDDIEIFSQQ